MSKKQSLFNVGATVLMAGAGMAVGGGPLTAACATMIGSVAGNMAGDLYKDGLAAFEDRIWSDEGLLNHDLAAALGRAMKLTLKPETLATDFQADGDYLRLKRHRPDKAEVGLAAVQGLAADLQQLLGQAQSSLNNLLSETDLQELALKRPSLSPQTALQNFIDPYAHGHEGYVKTFLQRRLDLSQLADYFMEELKQDGPAQWKMQTLFQQSLLTALNDLQGNDTRLLALATQQATDLATIQADLARLQLTASDLGQMKTALTTVLAQPLAELQAELQRMMTTEAAKTRDHVTGEHEATRGFLGASLAELEARLMATSTQERQQLMATIDVKLAAFNQQNIAASEQRALYRRERFVGTRPAKARAFFDRVEQLEQLRQAVQRPDLSILVITGRGGMGKTALSARLLDELETNLNSNSPLDGIACLSARGGRLDLGQLYDQLQRLFEGQELQQFWRSQAPLEEKVMFLLNYLQRGRYLVLLDNLEDSLTAEGLPHDEGVRLFLQGCLTQHSGVQLLITSREPLPFQDGRARLREVPLREGLPEAEAVQFLQTVDSDGAWGLRDAPETVLTELARRTHGIPRALEYVGAALANDETLTPQELLNNSHLWQQRVMQALQRESYRRLSDPLARQALAALAILGQPSPLVAVEFMLVADLRAALGRLVKQAFISFDRATGRYSLHPLDGEYLLSQMTAAERTALHSRAAEYYAQTRLPQAQWHNKEDVAPQLAEFEQRLALGQYDQAAEVLNEIDFDYLMLWGEARLVRDLRLQLVGKIADPQLNNINLNNLGIAYHNLGQVAKAITYYEQALTIAREIGDRHNESNQLGNLGEAYGTLGQVAKAITYYEQALFISWKIGDRLGESNHLNNLGMAYHALGQVKQAIGYYEQALVISRNIGARRNEGNHLTNLGAAYYALGLVEQAIEYYEPALAMAREMGNRQGESSNLGNLGSAYADLGQVDKAVDSYELALAITREIGDRRREGIWLGNLGLTYSDLGQMDKAISYYEQALTIAREIGDRANEGIYAWNLGLLYEESDPARAVALMSVLVAYEEEIGHPDAVGHAARVVRVRARVG